MRSATIFISRENSTDKYRVFFICSLLKLICEGVPFSLVPVLLRINVEGECYGFVWGVLLEVFGSLADDVFSLRETLHSVETYGYLHEVEASNASDDWKFRTHYPCP